MSDEITPNSPHTPTPNQNNENNISPSHPTSPNQNPTDEDQSLPETRVKPTGKVKIDADTIKERIEKLILHGAFGDELLKEIRLMISMETYFFYRSFSWLNSTYGLQTVLTRKM